MNGLQIRPPTSAEAHNAYLHGHFYFQHRNLDDYRKAVSSFDEAIRLDPQYALAYAERSEAWTLIGDQTGAGKTAWPKARSDAEKAVAIAPALRRGACGPWLGFASLRSGNFPKALRAEPRAKNSLPRIPTANDLLARVIVYLGRC